MSTVVVDSSTATFDLLPHVRLRIARRESSHPGFPTDRLQKGLSLEYDGIVLSEEGVGFGLPLLKMGRETVFPGALRLLRHNRDPGRVCVEYRMNLRERLSLGGSSVLKGALVSSLKEMGALLHRSYPFVRRAIMGVSNAARTALDIRTVFEQGTSAGIVRMEYRFDQDAGEVSMEMDATGVRLGGVSELILMNEQGASHFTEYVDSQGVRLRDRCIETWHAVAAEQASFRDPRHGIFFSVRRVPGSRLFRGREVVASRLAWAGFAYVLPPGTVLFRCSIAIGACP